MTVKPRKELWEQGLHGKHEKDKYLPSGFFSIRLNKSNHSQNERGECGLQRLFYTYA